MTALPLDKVCDFSFGLPPTRFIHGIKNRGHSIKNDVRDALESAALLCEHVALRRLVATVRAQTPFILCVVMGFPLGFPRSVATNHLCERTHIPGKDGRDRPHMDAS